MRLLGFVGMLATAMYLLFLAIPCACLGQGANSSIVLVKIGPAGEGRALEIAVLRSEAGVLTVRSVCVREAYVDGSVRTEIRQADKQEDGAPTLLETVTSLGLLGLSDEIRLPYGGVATVLIYLTSPEGHPTGDKAVFGDIPIAGGSADAGESGQLREILAAIEGHLEEEVASTLTFSVGSLLVYLESIRGYAVTADMDNALVYLDNFEAEVNDLILYGNPEVNAFVTRLYNVILQRDPDLEGLLNWSTLCLATREVAGTAKGFFLSPEFLGGIGATEEAFVTALYSVALDREPDPPGLAHNVGLITSGQMTREELVDGFLKTPEFLSKDPFR